MKNKNVIPVVLAGGQGTRLWPLSRPKMPKPFVSFGKDGETLFEKTMERVRSITSKDSIIVVNKSYQFLVQDLLRNQTDNSLVLLEPLGRNTAAALTMAAFRCQADDILLVLPADHRMSAIEFQNVVRASLSSFKENSIILFGIVPNRPETGYGYIKVVESDRIPFIVDRFIEKPQLEKACEYVKNASYYWNSGILMITAKTWLENIQKYRKDIFDGCVQAHLTKKQVKPQTYTYDSIIYQEIPSESIDYAVLEKVSGSQDVLLVPFSENWCDLGSWKAVHQYSDKDDNGNVVVGNVLLKNTQNTLAVSKQRMLVLNDVSDIAVIETNDAVLVTSLKQSQDIKFVVEHLEKNKIETSSFRRRPWGYFEVLYSSEQLKIKKIIVLPGEEISLQYHHHRDEFWSVVEGDAKVCKGSEVINLTEGDFVHIPKKISHQLINMGEIPLVVIRVQKGEILSERDIVRLNDKYQR